ncbi:MULTISPECIES: hypothetical protein [unclassified Fibrobacter]|uniref:hypothetical protein n=1 Tax=unclassified Fibrobacter TaxID=2634177 RepID=UPI0025B924A4|nr:MULTISPECIES: hypothetical protein [unclassified Fibrobacter]
MKRFLFGIALFGLLACNSDEGSSTGPVQEPVTVNWSLSGTFGGGKVDSVNVDTHVNGLISRSGSSKVHLNGYDTTYFENTVQLTHLQNMTHVMASIDADGYFSFDNMELFGLRDGMNSVRILPRAKTNVVLNPESFILYSNR